MALTDKLTAIADAIRGKTGGTEVLTLDQMATEIAGIETGGGGETFPQKIYETDFILEETITSGDVAICTISTGLNDATYFDNGEIFHVVIKCEPTDTSVRYIARAVQFLGDYDKAPYPNGNLFVHILNADGTDFSTRITSEGVRLTTYTKNLSSLTIKGKNGAAYPVAGTYHLELYRTGVIRWLK